MIDIKIAARNADKLRKQADHEHDPAIRGRLDRMADAYGRIVSTEAQAEAAPPLVHDLRDALTKRTKS